jgi:hypothetical protein
MPSATAEGEKADMTPDASSPYRSDGSHLPVDGDFWNRLAQRDINRLCSLTQFEPVSPRLLGFPFLGQPLRVDIDGRCLFKLTEDRWLPSEDPLLELVTVVYLARVDGIYPVGRDIVGAKDLKESHFFAGPHAFQVGPIVRRFGQDVDGFRRAAESLGGRPMDMADAAYRMMPFPRIPIYFLLWSGDDEFPSEIRILFDRPIESVLQADAIWDLVNRVARAIAEA